MIGRPLSILAAVILLVSASQGLLAQTYTGTHTEPFEPDRFRAFVTCSVEGKDLQALITKLMKKDGECRESLQKHAAILWARPFIREARQALSQLKVLDTNWSMTSGLGNPNSAAVGTFNLGVVYCIEVQGDLVSSLGLLAFMEELSASMDKVGLEFGEITGEPKKNRSRDPDPYAMIPDETTLIAAAKRGTKEALKNLRRLADFGDRPTDLASALNVYITQEQKTVRVVATLGDPREEEAGSTLSISTTVSQSVTPTRAVLYGEIYSMIVGSGSTSDADALALQQEKLQHLLEPTGLRSLPAAALYLLSTTGKIEETALVFDARKEQVMSTLWLQQLVVPLPWSGAGEMQKQLEELRTISAGFTEIGGSLHAGGSSIVSFFEARMTNHHRPPQFSALEFQRTEQDLLSAHMDGVALGLRVNKALAPFTAPLFPALLDERRGITTSDHIPDPRNPNGTLDVTVRESWSVVR